MRPLTLLSDEDLAEWGNGSIQNLANHFGQSQTHTYKDEEGETVTVTSPAVINGNKTMEEWTIAKQIVRSQMYPRDSTASLWYLLAKFHGDDLQNLIKLAGLALTHPVHTSDCERAFSAQNNVTTPLRNRLSSQHCDQLMRIMMEGPKNFDDFDFQKAVQVWGSQKKRLILK